MLSAEDVMQLIQSLIWLPTSLHKFFCSSHLAGKLKRRMTYADTYRSSEHPA